MPDSYRQACQERADSASPVGETSVNGSPPADKCSTLNIKQPAPAGELPGTSLQRMADRWHCDLTSQLMAQRLDDVDPLAEYRSQFQIPTVNSKPGVDPSLVRPGQEIVYMNGNSLGLKPKKADSYCQIVLQQWGDWGAEVHTKGFLPAATCDLHVHESHARLVGAEPDEVAVMNGLTVNLHLLLSVFYHPTPQRHKILIEGKAFPSDKYAVVSQIRRAGFTPEESLLELVPRPSEDTLRTEDILDFIERERHHLAVILIGGVQYFTGQKFDMEAIAAAGARAGAAVGLDLAHAVGNVALQLHDWGVDFACWCTYKYLNSGPGAIAGAFVHNKHKHAVVDMQPLQGWWGNRSQTRFDMLDAIDAAEGVSCLKLTNPPQMLVALNRASMDIFDSVSMSALLAKQRLLTGYLEQLVQRLLPEAQQLTPSDPEQRGCQLSLRFQNISGLHDQLRKRGVECDVRTDEGQPSVIRLAPAPLYNSYMDVFLLVTTIRAALDLLRRQPPAAGQ